MSQNTNTASALPRDTTQIKEMRQPGLKPEKIALIITTSVENLKVITQLLFTRSVNVLFLYAIFNHFLFLSFFSSLKINST